MPLLLLVLGCTAPKAESAADPACACTRLDLPIAPITDEAGLAALADTVRESLYPDEAGLTVGVEAVADLQFFRAWTEIETIANPPLERTYTIQYDPVVLQDPPDVASVAAVLAHELGHVQDYLAMDGKELLDFAGWYASQDPGSSDDLAAYERATDEKALERGCAAGLSAMREWIYAHVSAEVEAEKRRNYYSPEEIAAWEAAHGGC